MDRRHFVAGSAAAAAALGMRPAFAQDAYPSHAITFINPFPPGGAADVVGRPLVAMLEPILKQPCRHRNQGRRRRPGRRAGRRERKAGRLHAAASISSRSPASPKSTSCSAAPEVHARRFHSDRASRPQGRWCWWSTTSSPTRPQGAGRRRQEESGQADLQLVRPLRRAASADRIVHEGGGHPDAHLPTNGGGPALTAILGNNSQVLVSSIAAASGQIKAGKLRALACFSPKRAASLPDVPTMKELGYNVEFSLWVGVFAPKGTPARVVEKACARNQAGGEQRAVQDSNRKYRRCGGVSRSARIREILGRGCQARRGSRQRSAIGRVHRP